MVSRWCPGGGPAISWCVPDVDREIPFICRAFIALFPYRALCAVRRGSLVGRARGARPGVWTFSSGLSGGVQPAGLVEGSRWSFRVKGGTTTGKTSDGQAPRRGCQTQRYDARAAQRSEPPGRQISQQVIGSEAISSKRGGNESGTPVGVQALSCTVARRSPPQGTLGDLRLPFATLRVD